MAAEFDFIHDADRCVGCGLCVAFCPQYCLEVGEGGMPVATHMETCVGCTTCSGQCPQRAITIQARSGAAEYDPYKDEPRAVPISKEEQAKYAEWEKIIMDALDLRWHPVAVGIIDKNELLPDVPFPKEKLRYCQHKQKSCQKAFTQRIVFLFLYKWNPGSYGHKNEPEACQYSLYHHLHDLF